MQEPPDISDHPGVLAAIQTLTTQTQTALANSGWQIVTLSIAWCVTDGTEVTANAMIYGDTQQAALDYMADAIAGREEFDTPTEDITHRLRRN
jgi:hypothetical protein